MYYLSLQFSAIQKAIMRHDRLWAMAGTSRILSWLNEVAMPQIAKDHSGEVIVAGGGKFTARFAKESDAEMSKDEMVKLISTTLPMLEFQVAPVRKGNSFNEINITTVEDGSVKPGVINILNDSKRTYRGYGVTFNPHMRVCKECASYPAVIEHPAEYNTLLCRFCYDSFKSARLNLNNLDTRTDLTTLEKVYKGYLDDLKVDIQGLSIPMNFQDLFPEKVEKQRMAVWVSDLNNMNDKVPIWLSQDERMIFGIFREVIKINIEFIRRALSLTFHKDTFIKKGGDTFIPFRLIVAGGDDLCVVMSSEYILEFARNLDISLNETISTLSPDHPLHPEFLEKNSEGKSPEPYCYGGAFVVTDTHTPFKTVHEAAENLMKEAKEKTRRKENSVNWGVMSTEGVSSTERLLRFHRPLVYGDFNTYIELCKVFKNISSSRIYQISEMLVEHFSNGKDVEKALLSIPETWKADSHMNRLMKEDAFRDETGRIVPERMATFLELLTLQKEVSE
ncbi:MAG: hypothetical protein D6726_03260 [Nitrospirae bacterium]|nr:MAG: hypothetical protein D6726_03260 [Nitrospirota bacterium]